MQTTRQRKQLKLTLASSLALALPLALPLALATPAIASKPAPKLPQAPAEPVPLTQPHPPSLTPLTPNGQRLGELGAELQQDLLGDLDLKALEQVLQPLARNALRIFLNKAPDLSREAVKLSEGYLTQLGDRALQELEKARQDLDRNK